jgi:4-diphosphocytidyl-2-C-methyl-D-erythritol kinase
MVVFPNAKINLGLQITGKREDGYHNILSCFYPLPWCDILEIIESQQFKLESSGIPIPGKPEDNLCVKAYQMLKKDFQLPPVHIYLHKQIPMGAGLGGGSADASFVLKCLNELFHLFLDDSLLEEYALQLGSDCPFFINNQPVLASGRGEEFEPIALNLSGKYVVMVTPPVHISTAAAYAGIQPRQPEVSIKEILETQPIHLWKDRITNDFEASVFQQYPQIAETKERLYTMGALYASMSGSGASVYGIFEVEIETGNSFPDTYTIWKGLFSD